MRILSWIITLPIILAVVAFSLENRSSVALNFWPFDTVVTLPLSMLTLGMLFLGIILGSFVAWVSSIRYRLQIRKIKKELVALGDKQYCVLPERQVPENTPVKPSFISKFNFFGDKK